MTYNTHSCVGMDGRTSPRRIADIIREYAPDIVALQELDIGLDRTGSIDQAQYIADEIRMDYHFHPTLFIEEGQYGNAILTHFPMHVVRACLLPGLPGRTRLEKRGALWVEIMIGSRAVQVIVVHMGLNRSERLAQAMELTGSEWLTSPQCKSPAILCGDLNSFPGSRVHRLFKTCMRDAHRLRGKHSGDVAGKIPPGAARLYLRYRRRVSARLRCVEISPYTPGFRPFAAHGPPENRRCGEEGLTCFMTKNIRTREKLLEIADTDESGLCIDARDYYRVSTRPRNRRTTIFFSQAGSLTPVVKLLQGADEAREKRQVYLLPFLMEL